MSAVKMGLTIEEAAECTIQGYLWGLLVSQLIVSALAFLVLWVQIKKITSPKEML